MSGRVSQTGTHWRASYRWQPDDTVTAVAPYDVSSPRRLSEHSSCASRCAAGTCCRTASRRWWTCRNLLAEGYRPFPDDRWQHSLFCPGRTVGARRRFVSRSKESAPAGIARLCEKFRRKGGGFRKSSWPISQTIRWYDLEVDRNFRALPSREVRFQDPTVNVARDTKRIADWTRSSTGRAFDS